MNPREFDHLLAQALDAQAPPPDAALAERIAAAVAADAAGGPLPQTRIRWRAWLQTPRVSRLAGATAAGIVLALAAASWLLVPGQPAPRRLASAPPDAAYARALLRHAAAGPAAAPRPNKLAQLRPSTSSAPLSRRLLHAAALRHARLAQVTASRRHWPAVFPSPAPPSPQEQALLNFIATAPPRVVRAALTFPKPKWKWPAQGGAQTGPTGPPAGAEHFLSSTDKTEP